MVQEGNTREAGEVVALVKLRLLGEGEETAFAASAHGVGLIPAQVIKRASLGRVPVI